MDGRAARKEVELSKQAIFDGVFDLGRSYSYSEKSTRLAFTVPALSEKYKVAPVTVYSSFLSCQRDEDDNDDRSGAERRRDRNLIPVDGRTDSWLTSWPARWLAGWQKNGLGHSLACLASQLCFTLDGMTPRPDGKLSTFRYVQP